eukprot:g5501.t1
MGKKASRWGGKKEKGDKTAEDVDDAGGVALLPTAVQVGGAAAPGQNQARAHIEAGLLGGGNLKAAGGGRAARSEFEQFGGSSASSTLTEQNPEANLQRFLDLVTSKDEHCFCLKEGFCSAGDWSCYAQLREEFEFLPTWSAGGHRLRRDVIDVGMYNYGSEVEAGEVEDLTLGPRTATTGLRRAPQSPKHRFRPYNVDLEYQANADHRSGDRDHLYQHGPSAGGKNPAGANAKGTMKGPKGKGKGELPGSAPQRPHGQIIIGDSSSHPQRRIKNQVWERCPTYRKLVQFLVRKFEISGPLRSIINFYQKGDNRLGFHKDRYYATAEVEVNFTVGLSLGATRNLEFISNEEYSRQQAAGHGAAMAGGLFSFPQANGDIFAFSKYVNNNYRHGVPTGTGEGGGESTKGRISVVVWGERGKRSVGTYSPYEGDFDVEFAGMEGERIMYDEG